MSLGVPSYAALYTTLFGWEQYDNLWDILTSTNLALLPFVGMLLNNMREPFRSQEAKDATLTALKRIEFDFLAMLLCVVLFALPAMTLDQNVLSFSPLCVDGKSSDTQATVGDSGTTYDTTLSPPSSVKVPVFWYLVMSLAEGINEAAKEGIECQTSLRETSLQLSVTRIDDPKVRQQTEAFFNQCYLPAHEKYLRETDAQDSNGQADIQQLGSDYFLNTSGYYDTFKAQQSVYGFPYSESDDLNSTVESTHDEWGTPTCKAWWSDENYGLESQLESSIPDSLWDKINAVSTDSKQQVINKLISNSFSEGYQDQIEQSPQASGFVSQYLAAPLGIRLQEATYYPKMYVILQALPLIQAFLLMGLYLFLPFILVIGRYQLRVAMSVALGIVSITLWGYLWQFVTFLDNGLTHALYPGDPFNAGKSDQELIIDLTIGMLYIGLPLLCSALLGFAGWHMGSFAGSFATQAMTPAQAAGDTSGQLSHRALMSGLSSGASHIKGKISS